MQTKKKKENVALDPAEMEPDQSGRLQGRRSGPSVIRL